MRCVVRISLVLLGLALAGAPTAALADACPDCQANQFNTKHRFGSVKLCERCAKAQMAANGGVLPPPGPPMVFSNVPGMPGGQVCTTCQTGSMPPGYAVAGGQFASMDPAPIGVVRTNYQGPASASVAMPPGHAVVGPAGAGSGAGQAFASPNMVAPPEPNRPRILSNLIPRSRKPSRWQTRKEDVRSAHASIPYGSYAPHVNDLPASAVYGR